MRFCLRYLWLLIGTALLAGEGPYVLILGTAQDGGLPQMGCRGEHCRVALQDPAIRRKVASLLIVDPQEHKRWLVDASTDIRDQMGLVNEPVNGRTISGRRPHLVNGIFLTHAHMGHYAGLLQFGREAYHHPLIPVYASMRMCQFLRGNAPWNLLIENRNIRLFPLQDGVSIRLDGGLAITPVQIPHRGEITDTLGFIIKGPQRSLLYIPDIDKWENLKTPIEELVAQVDVALLDGTFFADGEIPGVSLDDIPHPFISTSLQRFARLPEIERKKIIFTHFNHTNPVVIPGSPAREAVYRAGMSLAEDLQRIDL